jgi:hypothetical protein
VSNYCSKNNINGFICYIKVTIFNNPRHNVIFAGWGARFNCDALRH